VETTASTLVLCAPLLWGEANEAAGHMPSPLSFTSAIVTCVTSLARSFLLQSGHFRATILRSRA
jgi:hypothetical protein